MALPVELPNGEVPLASPVGEGLLEPESPAEPQTETEAQDALFAAPAVVAEAGGPDLSTAEPSALFPWFFWRESRW